MLGRITVLGALAVFVVGCSSIISGTSQQLSINSSPSGATCILERDGIPIGQVTTPGGVNVTRTKHNIIVECTKDGYEPAKAYIKSEVADATFGNIILGGGIGWAIDSASGADNQYQETTMVTLTKAENSGTTGSENIDLNSAGSVADRIKRLNRMLESGLITEEEALKQRAKILEEL